MAIQQPTDEIQKQDEATQANRALFQPRKPAPVPQGQPTTPPVNAAPSVDTTKAPPMTPPAATPMPVTPAPSVPAIGPANGGEPPPPSMPVPGPAQGLAAGAAAPAGWTVETGDYDPTNQASAASYAQQLGWTGAGISDPSSPALGAAKVGVGNPTVDWVPDPVTGAFVKKGAENVQQANGQFKDGAGALTDPVGTTHTSYFDQRGQSAPRETMQRPGASIEDGPGGITPQPGEFGAPPVAPVSPGYTSSSGSQAAPPLPAVAAVAAPPAGGSAPVSAPFTPSATEPSRGVGVDGFTPEDDIRGKTVLPTNDVDRFKLADSRFSNYLSDILPQFKANLRKTYQGNAALGRLGSGMLRTDVGNLDLATERDANSKYSSLLNDALEGTIGDARSNRNEYRTERGRQDALENQAYDRGVQGLTLEDALTNSSFGRSLQQMLLGQQDNPAQTQLLLSQIFGNQASSAGNALANMVRSNAANGAAGQNAATNPTDILALLKQMGVNVGGGDANPNHGLE